MTAYLSPSPFLHFSDGAGNPLSGGLLFTYLTNTTTKATTYIDSSGTTANTNPIVLDSRGECNCWLPAGQLFTFVLSPSTDTDPPTNPIRTTNNVSASANVATINFGADTGAVNASVATIAGITSLFQGLTITLAMAFTNTQSATLNVNNLGAKPFALQGGAPLMGGELQAAGQYLLQYTGTVWQVLGLSIAQDKARTAAEAAAGVMPVNFAYPELNILRYGATAAGTGVANAAAIQQAVSVLAQHTDGELLIPAGFVFNIAKVTFTGMTQFNIRCDGVLQSSAASLGSFIDLHTSAGIYTPLTFTTCTRFKLYGKGYINPGFVDALVCTSCSDFDIALDCRGTNQNSVMRGILIQECFRFRVHDMTIDSITGLNVQGALTTTAVVNAGATSATATNWTGGVGPFNVIFTEVAGGAFEIRSVTFGAGTTNVSMTWSGGLAANCTATFYAEIYYDWLSALTIFSCYEFKLDHNYIKGHGGNGIYVLSVGDGVVNYCHDFDICDNLVEFNAESGIQLTFAGGTVCPVNYRVNNNTLKNNQADGIDVANTGPFANIVAQFNCNLHVNNGFINFNPANPGGVDGSGIGTFQNIGQFEAIGNVVNNCNNAGIYVSNCTQWRIANNIVGKTNGNSQGGVYISSSSAGSLRDCDVSVPTSIPSLSLLGNGNNVIIDGCNFGGGGVSLASGTYTGSKISRCSITGVGSINGVMDMIDSNVTLSGAAPVGIVCSAPNLKFLRNTINAPGPAINTNTANYIAIEDNITTVTAAQTGILVTGSNGCVVTGNNSTSTSSPAIQFAGTCTGGVLAYNKGNSASGNSFSTSAGTTLLSKYGNVSIGGTTSYSDTSPQVNFP